MKHLEPERNYLSLEFVAQQLGKSVKTIQNWIYNEEHDKLPPFTKVSHGVYRFPEKKFYQWLDARTQNAS